MAVLPRAALRFPILLLACLLAVAGCGRTSRRPETFPGGGVVTLDGKPLEGAVVSFQAPGAKYWAEGRTDAAGRYALFTFVAGDGALPGTYGVVITKYEDPATVPESRRERPDYVPRNLLPARYAATDTSGFSATVAAARGPEANRFDLNLQSKGR
jgi:hypothetical protein